MKGGLMTAKRSAGIFLAVAVAILISILHQRAVQCLEQLPTHRDYRPPEGFVHYSIGSLDRIDESLLGKDEVLLHDYGGEIGVQRNPLFIADFVMSLVPFANDPRAARLIDANLGWLLATARPTPGGNLVFPYDFDFLRLGEKAPWYSAMAQGRIGQAMMWGWRLNGDQRRLDAAKGAILAMTESGLDPPLAKTLAGGIWLKEFPRYRYHVLDGALVAMVGVAEVLKGLPNDDPDRERMQHIVSSALSGFVSNHRCFTTPSGGLLFADNAQLPTQAYYDIIMDQLAYLARYDPTIATIAMGYSLEEMPYIRRLLFCFWHKASRRLHELELLGPCVR
jgi:hypothetical protein